MLWALARGDVAAPGDPIGDELTGGNGNDTFRVRDGEADKISCGDGNDTVHADQYDVIVDATPANANGSCERVVRNSTPDADAGGEQDAGPEGGRQGDVRTCRSDSARRRIGPSTKGPGWSPGPFVVLV